MMDLLEPDDLQPELGQPDHEAVEPRPPVPPAEDLPDGP
jgi:hypothetical protein